MKRCSIPRFERFPRSVSRAALSGVFVLVLFHGVGCAVQKGDSVTCPVCDNVLTILVGTKCVEVSQVEVCGPDGHAHGTECHCFSGQATTRVGGKEHCLQQGCPGAQADAHDDHDPEDCHEEDHDHDHEEAHDHEDGPDALEESDHAR